MILEAGCPQACAAHFPIFLASKAKCWVHVGATRTFLLLLRWRGSAPRRSHHGRPCQRTTRRQVPLASERIWRVGMNRHVSLGIHDHVAPFGYSPDVAPVRGFEGMQIIGRSVRVRCAPGRCPLDVMMDGVSARPSIPGRERADMSLHGLAVAVSQSRAAASRPPTSSADSTGVRTPPARRFRSHREPLRSGAALRRR